MTPLWITYAGLVPANEKVHPIQFKLFMSAGEWQETMERSVDQKQGWNAEADEPLGDVWKRKLTEAKATKNRGEAHGAGTYESLKEHGFKPEMGNGPYDQPSILINRRNEQIQGEGHHRIAAAAELERETGENIWIPTNYIDINRRF